MTKLDAAPPELVLTPYDNDVPYNADCHIHMEIDPVGSATYWVGTGPNAEAVRVSAEVWRDVSRMQLVGELRNFRRQIQEATNFEIDGTVAFLLAQIADR